MPVAVGVLFCGVALSQEPTNDTQGPPVSGLVADHTALSVESIPTEAEWYERVLGFKVSAKINADPSISSWRMVIPGFRLDLLKYVGSKRPAPVYDGPMKPFPFDPVFMQQGWIHMVFRVEDLGKAATELQALHVKIEVIKNDKGNPIQIILHDPEGNEIRIRPFVEG